MHMPYECLKRYIFSYKVTKFVLRAYYTCSLYNMLLRSGLWNRIQTPLQDLTLPASILCMFPVHVLFPRTAKLLIHICLF